MTQAPDLDRDGARRHAAILSPADRQLIERLSRGDPGLRLTPEPALSAMLSREGTLGRIAAAHRPGAQAVRAVLFDKTPEANWALAWHQDRTIVVAEREDMVGFGPWSTKAGMIHVEPPFALLEGMLTLRAHVDDCGVHNAPLLAARGSHKLGRIRSADAGSVADALERLTCTAHAGDVWAYATPILHASERARRPGRRRVLQVDYCAGELPAPLRWAWPA